MSISTNSPCRHCSVVGSVAWFAGVVRGVDTILSLMNQIAAIAATFLF
jgi:hypothetical protein